MNSVTKEVKPKLKPPMKKSKKFASKIQEIESGQVKSQVMSPRTTYLVGLLLPLMSKQNVDGMNYWNLIVLLRNVRRLLVFDFFGDGGAD